MIDLQLCEYNYDLMENQYRSTDCNKSLIRLLLDLITYPAHAIYLTKWLTCITCLC